MITALFRSGSAATVCCNRSDSSRVAADLCRPGLRNVFERGFRFAPAGLVDAPIYSHPPQPEDQVRRRLNLPKSLKQLKKDILGHVLGLGRGFSGSERRC